MSDLIHLLERTVTIRARRETVFSFFRDSDRFAAWWGAGSRIDPRPGGEVRIHYPNDVIAAGAVVELDEPHRVVFTYGYESGQPIAVGASLVTITLEEHPDGTTLHLHHAFADAAVRDQHAAGWGYQLALFANAVARVQHAGAEALVDRFLAVWSEKDQALRATTLAAIAVPELTFRDEWAASEGIGDLAAHIGAAQFQMPAMTLERDGPVRQCQGTALANWVVRDAGGTITRRGTNVFELAPDGRLTRVVGLWT